MTSESANGRLQPPWLVYPHIQFASIGWRMGPGEDYWVKFDAWYAALSGTERDQYERDYPEPKSWDGFYARKKIEPPKFKL
jgi:hypothetical protein